MPGEKLPLERLAGQLSMGTTPLREALSRLAVEVVLDIGQIVAGDKRALL